MITMKHDSDTNMATQLPACLPVTVSLSPPSSLRL